MLQINYGSSHFLFKRWNGVKAEFLQSFQGSAHSDSLGETPNLCDKDLDPQALQGISIGQKTCKFKGSALNRVKTKHSVGKMEAIGKSITVSQEPTSLILKDVAISLTADNTGA